MTNKIEIDVASTAEAIAAAAARAHSLGNELEDLAKSMVAENDIGIATFAIDAILNAVTSFRLDQLVTRPIRAFQTKIAVVESQPAPAEDAKFAGKTKLQILHEFGYAVFPEDGGFSATILDDTEAFYVRCKSMDEAIKEAYAFLFGEVDPSLHKLSMFDFNL